MKSKEGQGDSGIVMWGMESDRPSLSLIKGDDGHEMTRTDGGGAEERGT